MRTIIAALLALALTGGAAWAQQGYWSNGNQSIYSDRYIPQWNDTSNSGPLYSPPIPQSEPSRFRSTTCYHYGNMTVCD